jgi:hypothetical protein
MGEVGFEGTGVFATEAEVATLRSYYDMPIIMSREFTSPACNIPERIHAVAMGHGLSDFDGYYGCNYETREFLKPQGVCNEDRERRKLQGS